MESISEQAARLGVTLPQPSRIRTIRLDVERDARAEVKAADEQLTSDTWAQRDDREAMERAQLIHTLVKEQLQDDTPASPRDRIGSSWVLVYDLKSYGEEMFDEPVQHNEALAVTLDPVLQVELTGEQRVTIRALFYTKVTREDGSWAWPTLREVADQLHISHVAVLKRKRAALKALRTRLLAIFHVEPQAAPLPVEPPGPFKVQEWDRRERVTEPAYLDEPYVPMERGPVDHLIFRGAP
jgi:hypothetical protein